MALRAVLICDHENCDAVYDFGKRSYHREILAAAHADGWSSTVNGSGWVNTCEAHAGVAA